ncbi:MAG: TnpV protein [Clostridia bacterium]|nr:TnpV protein [Clostridia bacterium]
MSKTTNSLTYRQEGDVLLPNMTLGEMETRPIGKYGRMRKRYLMQNRPVLYNSLVFSGKLQAHLLEIEETAQERLTQMMREMKEKAGLTELVKAENQMLWVGQMNALKAQAEEILMAELIYN